MNLILAPFRIAWMFVQFGIGVLLFSMTIFVVGSLVLRGYAAVMGPAFVPSAAEAKHR